jgi:hypothetical protein
MRTLVLLGVAGTVALGLTVGHVNSGHSAADSAAVEAAVRKLAAAIEKKDAAEQKKQVEVLQGANVLDLMDLYKLRTSEGLGVGPKPGVVKPDGIEAKVQELAGSKPYEQQRLDAEGEHLATMAYTVAAIAMAARAKCPVKVTEGDRDPKKWRQWSEELEKAAVELAEAARAKKLTEARSTAGRVHAACTSCHAVFRRE